MAPLFLHQTCADNRMAFGRAIVVGIERLGSGSESITIIISAIGNLLLAMGTP